MNKYRTHNCGELSLKNKDQEILLSGWINKKRDHGNLLFFDLRDNYGITQCVIDKKNKNFFSVEKTHLESVVRIKGKVIERTKETINSDILTGQIEIQVSSYEILSECAELPLPVFSDQNYSEEIRLKYRFLDLRRKKFMKILILDQKLFHT